MTIQVGQVLETRDGPVSILELLGAKQIRIKFLEYPWETVVRSDHLKNGKVKNRMKPIQNKGFIGDGPFSVKDKDGTSSAYFAWKNMLRRVYGVKTESEKRWYGDVEVCKDWLNFQNYAEWYYRQLNEYTDGKSVNFTWHVDKDLLFPGNRLYCPKHCVLIPGPINCLLLNSSFSRGSLPIGVNKRSNTRYEVRFSEFNKSVTIGYYDTLEKARIAYWESKFKNIQLMTILYFQYLPYELALRFLNFGWSDAIAYYGLETVLGLSKGVA